MIKTGVRYRCDRCGFERFVLDGSMSKAEKDKIAKEWFTVPDADGKEIALCPDCRMVYESRYIEMMENSSRRGRHCNGRKRCAPAGQKRAGDRE